MPRTNFSHPRLRVRLLVWASTALLATLALVAVWRIWGDRTGDPEAVLASSAGFLGNDMPDFHGALDVAWHRALDHSKRMPARRLDLLLPDVPPALCPSGDAGGLTPLIIALDAALAAGGLDGSVDDALVRLGALHPTAPDDAYYQHYNLARARLVLGDTIAATREMRTVERWMSDAIPKASAKRARADVVRGIAHEETAAAALAGRLLAGIAAMSLGNPEDAISHFRLAVRATNYLPTTPDDGGDGRYRRLTYASRAPLCGQRARRGVGSLDAYAALAAAYLVDSTFRDPRNLAAETERPFAADPDDPLVPVIRYGNRGPRKANGSSTIPEHFIWAAANVEGITEGNVADPDSRLTVTRGVLVLDLLEHTAWRDAIRARDACSTLRTLGRDLIVAERRRRLVTDDESEPIGADSALAALAIHVQSRLGACDASLARVDDSLRVIWLGTAGPRLGDPLGLMAERARRVARTIRGGALRSRSVADARALAWLHAPRDLMPVHLGARGRDAAFREQWQAAFFGELADSLHVVLASGNVRGSRATELLRTIRHASYLAGRTPSATYQAREAEPLLRALSVFQRLTHRIYFDRVALSGTLLGILAGTTILVVLIAAAYMFAWRYTLLTRVSFYAQEPPSLD